MVKLRNPVLQKPNVLIMDEPTTYLDMESIESFNMALDMFDGTLVFVSHDRELINSLAGGIIEITSQDSFQDFKGTYDEYLQS